MEHPLCKKPPEQGTVSVELPSQASAEAALQLRNLNFLLLDEVVSHSDHSPHSAQVPTETAEKKIKEHIYNFFVCLCVCGGSKCLQG